MSSASTKIIQAAAGNAAGEPLYVEDVFSTYLFDSSNSVSPVTVTNGIDLAGEGGMVWVKSRTDAGANPTQNNISDTERGTGNKLITNGTYANIVTQYENCSSFNSDGFAYEDGFADSTNKASWTFRKAPKFFDVVTYTGNGVQGRTVSHNLGSVPGCIIIKKTNAAKDWAVFHRGKGKAFYGLLNTTAAFVDDAGDARWNDTDPTATEFTLGNDSEVNANGDTYVAYLFAHNDDDGGFGENADQDIIKCGSYTGNGSTDGPEIDLGFEPQFVIIKRSSASEDWLMFDSMRGMVVGGIDPDLRPSQSQAEGSFLNYLEPQPTGFKLIDPNTRSNDNGSTYIYIAIRRGPMKTPESGTEVFAIDTQQTSPPNFRSGFPVDTTIYTDTDGFNNWWRTRLTGETKYLASDSTNAEATNTGSIHQLDRNDGVGNASGSADATRIYWMFRRAPGFFDVVAYTGTGSTQTVDHNLGVTPEIMIVKRRDTAGYNWAIYTSALGATKLYSGFGAGGPSTNPDWWNDTAPTDSVFTVNTQASVNASGGDYIAYLFASLDGISKIGTYTGNGSTQTINCGFSSGARFILIRPTTADGNWVIFDSERGIVAGNDPYLKPGDTSAEATNDDGVDPDSSGFIVNELTNSGTSLTKINQSGVSYTFLAIA